MPNSELVQSLKRGLELLKMLSMVPDGLQLNELAAASGLKKTTVYNLMRTLCAGRFAVKDKRGRYKIGSAAVEIGGIQVEKERLMASQGFLKKLAGRFPESIITVSALSQGYVRCLMRVSPENAGTVQFPAAHYFLPYVSASAILLQAMNPEETAFLEEQYPFDEYGAGMWGVAENFSAAKKKVVAEGYCCIISKKSVKIALPMPDLYVLGINTPDQNGRAFQEYRDAGDEFRRVLQNAMENKK